LGGEILDVLRIVPGSVMVVSLVDPELSGAAQRGDAGVLDRRQNEESQQNSRNRNDDNHLVPCGY
jgi:hypothetical protein